MRAVGRWS